MNTLDILQQQEIISIREFIKNLSQITSNPKKKIYTVVKNGKIAGFYIPQEFKDELLADMYFPEEQEEKKYDSILARHKEIAFSGGDPNLAMNIDKILYGAE